ncbi:malonyl-CoA decarboxylase [Salinarimonas soli]|uniref:MCD, Malonyl-CoA decarboxylase MCD n=1 Tax=Salinarimonas soli TaxID=1638099 RepID=A0A5B2V5S4_9HYPH|nr:MCD, Malonyl-CoA decarboxylase MCD [Salinarimonas soli]
MIQTIADRGRSLITRPGEGLRSARDLAGLAEEILSGRGEASAVARARDLLDLYAAAPPETRRAFLKRLSADFGPAIDRLDAAIEAYRADPTPSTARALHQASEPRRQELMRRLNRAPGGTLSLVRMREDVLPFLADHPDLADVDADFAHLFGSWFNRGFLTLKRIDWTSPANVLEKIIAYEAVHAIQGFEDLRRRLAPPDRRLYAFFHPALVEEPLIFVEVALTRDIPGAIGPILAPAHAPLAAAEATTAVFYSISNCQRGLAGISFGNFLIKQVVEELRRDLPGLKTFVTLSPVPGFAAWLARERDLEGSAFLTFEDRARLDAALDLGASLDEGGGDLQALLRELAATYLIRARTPGGRPVDPVARFHLGNGARLERIHPRADLSPRGIEQGAGFMVNYLYDLDSIERNHEAFAERGEVVAAADLRRLARVPRTLASA